MKRFTVIIIAVLLPVSVMAGNGTTSFGIKAGYTKSTLNLTRTSTYPDYPNYPFNTVTQTNQSLLKGNGFNISLVFRADLNPVYFQFEVLYDRYNNNLVLKNKPRESVTSNTFSFPMLFGVYLNPTNLCKVRLNLGPVLNIISFIDMPVNAYFLSEDMFRKPVISWTAGLGLDLAGVMFDFRYNGVFSSRKTEYMFDSKSSKLSSITLNLGYLF